MSGLGMPDHVESPQSQTISDLLDLTNGKDVMHGSPFPLDA
jgi:hypothetical protein